MTPVVIAVDVDGTLFDGRGVAPAAAEELAAAREAGDWLVLVTGRRWIDLGGVLGPVLGLFHRAVVEEGGALVDVDTGRCVLLAPALAPELLASIEANGVHPVVGLVTVGAPVRHAALFADVAQRLGGQWHVVTNKESVALAPRGHDKATGLRAALVDLDAAALSVLAIGDAANDLPMFAVATVAVAVANADEAVVQAGVRRTAGSFGSGVAEALHEVLPTLRG